MTFQEALEQYNIIVANGPLGTRLKYDYKLGAISIAELIARDDGRNALKELYKADAQVALENGTPIILNAATYRASRNFFPQQDQNPDEVRRVNLACIDLVKTVRSQLHAGATPVFIGAPIGSMHDAYSAENVPSIDAAKQYHQEQVNLYKAAAVDLVYPVTLPSANEATGIALACQEAGLPYIIGFIINKDGKLLDRTPLHEAMQRIDRATVQKPLGYLITCTHPSTVKEALRHQPGQHERIIGLQANASNLSPAELNNANEAKADSAESLAQQMEEIRNDLPSIKILAGCCGTATKHLRSIIGTCKPKSPSPSHH